MKKLMIFLLGFSSLSMAQFAPAVGQPGSTAIKFDDPAFVAWGTNVTVVRGYVKISDTTFEYQGSNRASFGEPSNAEGSAGNTATDAVSLGDSGVAIVTFNQPIVNGQGYDFAVFENGVTDNFLELGHVEVSSDGVHYVRFPSVSATQTTTQIGSFGTVDPEKLYNLAGKYKVGYGTPFDLEELKDSASINIMAITHIKIIDVVGTIGPKGTVDSQGNKINELFPTPFNTGGFDLTGVGVIHQATTSDVNDEEITFSVYPNPTYGAFTVKLTTLQTGSVAVYDFAGRKLNAYKINNGDTKIQMNYAQGVYVVVVKTEYDIKSIKVIVK